MGHASQGNSSPPQHSHTRAHSTRVAGPGSPPRWRAAGEGEAPEPRRSPQWRKAHPPPRDAPPPPPQYATAAHKGTTLWGRCWDRHHPRRTQPPQGMQAKGKVLGPHTRTRPATARWWRTPAAPRRRAAGGGRAPGLRGSSQRGHTCYTGGRGSTQRPHEHANAGARSQGLSPPTHVPPRPQHVHQRREIRTPSPALRHSDTTMAEPAAPRKTRPRSPTLGAAHEVIKALGLRGG